MSLELPMEVALAFAGKGAAIDAPFDRIQALDENTLQLTSSVSRTALLRITVPGGVILTGCGFRALSEMEDE